MEASDKNVIAEAIRARAGAIAAKDASAVASYYASDVVAFDLAPPLKTTGFDRKALEAWFATWDGPIGYEITDQHLDASGALAVARSLNHMTGKKIGGEQVDLWTRSTVCFRKEGNRWLVTHVHSSVPLTMDGSGKAATDLKP
jgi:ketosteroid isomerase-like protein